MERSKDVEIFLANYKNLVSKIDEKCASITEEYSRHINCKKGCSSCCILESVFPVEAVSIAIYIIDHKIPFKTDREGENCNFLKDGVCLIYDARPIICRTHGFPFIYQEDGKQKADCCPLNFENAGDDMSVSAFMDMDKINNILYTVNSMFIKELNLPFEPDDRIFLTDIGKFI